MASRVSRRFSLASRRGFRSISLLLATSVFAGCGSSSDGDGDSKWPTSSEGGSGGTGAGTGGTGTGGSRAGSGGSGGGTGGTRGGTGGTTPGGDASAGSGGGTVGDAGSPDSGTSPYVFPLTLTPLTTASTSTSNISLYFSVTDKKGVGVVGLPRLAKVPADATDPFNWVYREDGQDLDPKESGFSVTPLQGNTLDMPTVLILDLSGSIVGTNEDGGLSLLERLKQASYEIIDKMLPEQRMAVMTFAGTATVRMQFSTDKDALKKSVRDLATGDGQSTNLYGAMIEAFKLWQDGFVTAGGVKLTAGVAIVVTDGKDNAGVNTLSDVIAARKNKRVISVGIGDSTSIDVDAMTQLARTGTFVQVTSFDTLNQQIGSITNAMATLGRSIYTANYCTPKLKGTHELLFTVQGNGSTVSTTCTPATFPSNHPSLCAQLDPSYTQACGYTKGPSTYTCCKSTTPYTCPNDSFCYATAAEAAAKCGAASVGGGTGGCIMCGGTGTGASQDTQLVPGSAIRVRFDATNFKPGQCPEFWGPNCKAAQTCCTQVPSDRTASCNSAVLAALGNESTCQMLSAQYCGIDAGIDAGTDGRADAGRDSASGGAGGTGGLPPPPFPPPGW